MGQQCAGGYFSLALREDGTVVGWGDNQSGQTSVPGNLKGVTALGAGMYHAVALKDDGTVASWGQNDSGQCDVPVGLSGVVGIAAGGFHSAALKDDSTVVAWGLNTYGQSDVPMGLSDVVEISAGVNHSVALKGDGTVVAWGNNDYGQVTIPQGLSGVSMISAGYSHTVALKSDGTVVAWGNNDFGQTTVPPGLSGVMAVTCGQSYTVALKNDGTVVVWGDNSLGQATVPAGLAGVIGVSAGPDHTIAIKSDGSLVAWGNNSYGKAAVPTRISGVVEVKGGYGRTVAVKANGTVVSSGRDDYGQATPAAELTGIKSVALGDSHTLALGYDGTVTALGNNNDGQTSVPPGLSNVIAVAACGNTNVALKSDGTLVTWGDNYYGQAAIPAGLSEVTAVAEGGGFTVALKTDGTVAAWGYNDYGETAVPAGLTGVTAISAGADHTLALKSDGTVVAWGDSGQGQTAVPAGLSGIVGIAAGDFHSLALRSDGTVVAWGNNDYGQTTVPAGLSGVVAVAAGSYHSLALKNDGTLIGWGDNGYGQITLSFNPYESVLPGTVSYNPSTWTATYVPTSALPYSALIEASLSQAITTQTGVRLPDVYAWRFTTEQGPTIKTTTLPDAYVGAIYSHSLAATGGTTPYTWRITSGSLPGGLSLTTAGVINGTPTTAGKKTFTVQVRDAGNKTATKTYSITVYSIPTITAINLLSAYRGRFYSQSLSATGGKFPFGWNITSGSLPAGLSLDSSSGLIGGTPTTVQSSTFTVQIMDTNGVTSNPTEFTITVNPPLAIEPSTVPDGYVGVPYNQSLSAANGNAPYTWTLGCPFGGSCVPMPPGLSFDASTALINGTPTETGNTTFSIALIDADNQLAISQYTLKVLPNLAINTANLPASFINFAYHQTFSATGGLPPYSWTIADSSLPAGLLLEKATGALTGTPTSAGTSSFTIRVTDANGFAVNKSFSLAIHPLGEINGVATDQAGMPLAGVTVTLAISDILSPERVYLCDGAPLSPADSQKATANDNVRATCNTMTLKVRNPYTTAYPFSIRWNGISTFNDNEYVAQSFRPSKSGMLTKVSLHMSDYANAYGPSSGDIYVLLKSSLGGERGVYLAKSNNQNISPTTPVSWIDFDFAAPVPVTAGEEYYLEAQGYLPSWELFNDLGTQIYLDYVYWSNGAEYTNGKAYVRNRGNWILLANPLAFRTYITSEPDIDIAPSMDGGVRMHGSADHYWPPVLSFPSGVNPGYGSTDQMGSNYELDNNSGDYMVNWKINSDFTRFYDADGWLSIQVDRDSAKDDFGSMVASDEFSLTFNRTSSVVTDANGAYSFPSLPDGSYTINFDKASYASALANGALQPGEAVSINPELATATSLQILNDRLSLGSIGSTVYRQALAAKGGNAPYRWSVIGGWLPEGLTLDENTGVIAGEPLSASTYTFFVRVQDSANTTATKGLSITISSVAVPSRISVSPDSLSFGYTTTSTPSSQNITVTNIGATDLAIGQLRLPQDPFRITNDTCSNKTLSASAACTIAVEFAPTQEKVFSDLMTIPCSDENYPYVSISLSGHGIFSYAVPDTGKGEYVRNPLRYRVINPETVQDLNTRLIWQRGGSETALTWAAADTYCRSLALDGSSDWRLPNFMELTTIVKYAAANPAIDSSAFTATTSADYWTSTTTNNLIDGIVVPYANTVNLQYGEGIPIDKTSTAFARCVRGETLTNNVIKLSQDLLYDLNTQLTWMANNLDPYKLCANFGNCSSATGYNLQAFCERLDGFGYSDWRVPTVKELTAFPTANCPTWAAGDCFSWSATSSGRPDASGDYSQIYISNMDTITSVSKSEPFDKHQLRCVRGGNLLQLAQASVTPASVDFGTTDLGTTPTRSVTVSNTGGGSLSIGTIASPAAPFAITGDTCSGNSLAGGASCIITVQLAATAEGSYSGNLTIPTSDTTMTVPMTGTAISPAPFISSITIGDIGPDSAVVTWSTDQPATGAAQFGTTTGYGYRVSDTALATEHTVTLSGLTPGTVHHMRAVSANAAGREAASGDYSFVTQTLPQPGEVPADNYLSLQEAYNKASHNDNILALDRTYAEDLSINRPISVTVRGGYASTAYSARSGSTVISGSLTIADGTFTADNITIAGSDPNSILTISNITAAGTTITWNTSLLANSRIDFGETVGYSNTIADKALTTAHSVILTGLKPGTTYHYKVTSVTPTGIAAESADYTLTTPDFVAAIIAESGNVTVMEVNGDFSSTASLARQETAKEYLRKHGDDYDFLVFLSTFDYALPDAEAKGFYTPIRNDVQGINQAIFDNTSQYGSNGKLQGTIDLGNVTTLAANPYGPKLDETVTTLNHEIGHRWGSYVRFKNPDGTINTALLGKDSAHWSYLLDSKGSLMYGNGWQDNTDGTFMATAKESGFSPLDLYLMGMIPKEQVPPMTLIDSQGTDKNQLPQLGATITGTARTVSIDDIIAAEGARLPDAATSQKQFNVGFVLLIRKGDNISAAVAATETLKRAWAGKFAELTRGAGKAAGITPSLAVQVDSPADGATITGPDVTVTGTVINTNGAETGVMVNGVPATITGSRFTANHVPLRDGSNTITVTATDANGLTGTANRSVTAQTGHYLRITSNIDSGTGPLDISIRLAGSFTITSPTVNVAGPVAVTLTAGSSPTEYTVKLLVEGTYTFTASAMGPDGQTYSDSLTVTVLSKWQLETLLQGKWARMKAKLTGKDLEGALTFLITPKQAEYRNALGDYLDKLPLLAQNMQSVEFVYGTENRAKVRMFKEETVKGQRVMVGYPIYFIRENGVWRLLSF